MHRIKNVKGPIYTQHMHIGPLRYRIHIHSVFGSGIFDLSEKRRNWFVSWLALLTYIKFLFLIRKARRTLLS